MKRAFTLIELLVVIAIIAILAAILFPVFAQAKEAAKASQILSNQKQMALAQQMYITDSDDVLPAWFTKIKDTRSAQWYRDDINSWPLQFAPYIKNGTPVWPQNIPTTQKPGYVPPTGVQYSPMWDEKKWEAAAEQPDCDGAGALASWVPTQWVHSHFGLSVPFETRDSSLALYSPSSGTQADPDYFFAGSYLPGTPTNGALALNFTMSNNQIVEVARTALVTDGFTGVINTGGFGTTIGCESSSMYKGGGNIAFCDSHVKFIKGNNQRYLQQDNQGRWFMKYFTVDR